MMNVQRQHHYSSQTWPAWASV